MSVKIKNITITIAFLLAIFIPFFTGIIEQGQIISSLEKRKLAKFPRLPKSLNEFKQLPKSIDNYFSDNFGFRTMFTKHYKSFKLAIGDSPSSDVTLGSDDWLFLGSNKINYTKFGDPIGDYRNINLYTENQLERLGNYLQKQQNWLQKQGIKYYFFIAPNKHTIYSEMLPSYIRKKGDVSATDQLLNYLAENTSVSFIDIRPNLLAQKHNKQLYYKTDTHWNHEAANIVQFQLMQEMQKSFPQSISAELFSLINSKNGFSGDLARFIGTKQIDHFNPKPVFENDCQSETEVKLLKAKNIFTLTCKNQALSLLVYGDSYFKDFLVEYFARKFKSTTFLWRKPNFQSFKDQIKQHNPDIIVEEWIERHLPYIPKSLDK